MTKSAFADAIDHLVIATPDIEAARAEMIAMGFQVTPRAIHEHFGTENYLIILEDAYIELLGISGRPAATRTSLDVLEPCLAAGGGAPMIALSAQDIMQARARLAVEGVAALEPMTWSRPADTPDGQRTATFTTMFLNSPWLPGMMTFYCAQHTPEVVRHPAWRVHPNGARRLLGMHRASRAECAAARHTPGGERIADGVCVRFGGHVLDYRDGPDIAQVTIALTSDARTTTFTLASVPSVSLSLQAS